jgi:hypothetical protein
MYPIENDWVVPQGLARLTSSFITQPNIRAILAVYLQPAQTLELVFWDIINARVLSTAIAYDPNATTGPTSNVVFDDIGALVGLTRQGLDDTDYRTLIYLEIAVNRSCGRTTDFSRFAQLLDPYADLIYYLDGDAAVYFGCWNFTLNPTIVAAQLTRAPANGVGGVFAYTLWPDGADFEWSDWYDGSDGQGASGQYPWGSVYDPAEGGLLVAAFALGGTESA